MLKIKQFDLACIPPRAPFKTATVVEENVGVLKMERDEEGTERRNEGGREMKGLKYNLSSFGSGFYLAYL